MICTASTLSDTKWKIIAAAIAEKAKPTVLDTLAARKITSDTGTQDGTACARSTKSERDQPKCQAETLAIVAANKTSVTRPIMRPLDAMVCRIMVNRSIAMSDRQARSRTRRLTTVMVASP